MPVYKTKGELRSSLLIKLGYGGLGAAASNFVPIADELLNEAQEVYFNLLPDDKLVREWEFQSGLNQRFYDFPLDCDPDRIEEIAAFFEQTWLPMNKGIDSYHDSIFNYINYYPQRYDIRNRANDLNLQLNGGMTTEDVTATGGTGWTWGSGTWEITGGVATQKTATAGTITSNIAVVSGETYDVTYSIGGETADTVTFGGTSADVNGVPLGRTVGTHTHRILAGSTTGLAVSALNTATLTTLDNCTLIVSNANTGKEMLEVWPVDESVTYPIKIEGWIKLMPFVQDGDRATIDDRLILMHAEAYGKAHLNKPDAQVRMAALNKHLSILRGQQHAGKKYQRRDKTPDPLPRPIVIPQLP